jgi:tetratricopeptide (TPR) repeat protein
MSQSDLAGAEFSASYVSLIESGKRQPSDEALVTFARRLGCSADDLRTQSADDTTPVELELSYARLTLANGEPKAARARLEAVLDRPEVGLAQRHESVVLLAETYEKTSDLDGAIRVLKPVYDLCLQGSSPLPITTVAYQMCWYCVTAGDLQAAVRVGERALEASVDAGLTGTADHLKLQATVMGIYLELGDSALALAVADDLIRTARAAGSAFGEAAAYWNAALVAESRGRLFEALRLSQRALGLMSEEGSSRNLTRLQYSAAELILRAEPGRAWQASAILDQSLPALEDLGSPKELGVWESVRAVAYLLTGDPKSAERLARRARVHLQDAGDFGQTVNVVITLGDSLVAQGRQDAGMASYREAARLLSAERPGWRAAVMYRSIAYRLSLGGDPAGAAECLQSALEARGVSAQTAPADVAFGRCAPSPAPSTAEPLAAEPLTAEPLTAESLAAESLAAESLTAEPLTAELFASLRTGRSL